MSDKNKAKEILSNIFGYLLIVATCALYVLTAVFILNPTGKTFWQAIADGFLSLGIGITLDHLFRQQGLISGLKSASLTKTMILYGSTIEKINDYINKLGDWCVNKNRRTYKEQRTKILSRAGLRYQDCFHDDGTAKPYFADFEEIPIVKNREKLKDRTTRKSEKIRIKSIKRKNKEAKKIRRDSESVVGIAKTYVALEKEKKSKKMYERMLKKNFYDSGLLMGSLKVFPQRADDYLPAIVSVDITNNDIWLNMAHLAIKDSNYVMAETYLNNSYYIDGNNFKYYYYLSLVLSAKGEIEKAKQSLAKCSMLEADYIENINTGLSVYGK